MKRGRLYVVATPIGNLEDITRRAARILGEAAWIACEDTRVTGRLCAHLGVEARLLRHEAHNEEASVDGVLNLLERGDDVALVSDAGTPTLSDPGQRLVGRASEEGYEVIPIPGVSAITTALSVSGMSALGFHFGGFLPKKRGKRQARLAALGAGTHVFFCPARDLPRDLADLAAAHPDAAVVVGREMTKRFETWYRGSADELAKALAEDPDVTRGEAVIVVDRPAKLREVDDDEVAAAAAALRNEGRRASETAAEIAARFGIDRSRAYRLASRTPGRRGEKQ